MKPTINPSALEFWDKQEANDNGVLGGYGHLSEEDIRGSLEFYNNVTRRMKRWKKDVRTCLAADVGGGVGRVTKHLLLKVIDRVDLVEPSDTMRSGVRSYINDDPSMERVRVIASSFEDCVLEENAYDVIWLQWVCMYVEDDDVLSARLKDLSRALRCNGGVLYIKDNLTKSKTSFRDQTDSSVCRNLDDWLAAFERAGLQLIHSSSQRHWPKNLFDVHMFALIAETTDTS